MFAVMNFAKAIISGKLYPPQDTKPDFSGRNIIVTGSNTGLGFEAALKCVEQGAAKVIVATRSQDKGNAAKQHIAEKTGKPDVVEVWSLDMLDYDSIRAFVRKAEGLDHLDIAILNAGVWSDAYEKSRYGWERTLQVNVLSTVLLALLLLPKLKQSKTAEFTPVLEIVDSGTHIRASPNQSVIKGKNRPLEFYNDPAIYAGQVQYGMSKLFLQYAVQELATSMSRSSDTLDAYVISVCPGACKSELSRDKNGLLISAAKSVIFTVFRTAEEGSRTYISGISLGEKGHGRFWQHDQIKPQRDILVGDVGHSMQQAVWADIMSALKKDVPELTSKET